MSFATVTEAPMEILSQLICDTTIEKVVKSLHSTFTVEIDIAVQNVA